MPSTPLTPTFDTYEIDINGRAGATTVTRKSSILSTTAMSPLNVVSPKYSTTKEEEGQYPAHPPQELVFWPAMLALVGGLFVGYAPGVIAGAGPLLQYQFNQSDAVQGILVSAILFGQIMGGFSGGYICDKLGRRHSTLAFSVIGLVGNTLTVINSYWAVFAFRIIVGFAVGLSSCVVPLYISETTSDQKRGMIGSMFQLALTFGIFISYVIGFACNTETAQLPEAWRWQVMFAVGNIFPLMSLTAWFFMPESQRWIDAMEEVKQKGETASGKNEAKAGISELFTPRGRRPLFIACLMAIAQQLTGINAIMYYGPVIFSNAGVDNAMIPTMAIGAWNFIATGMAVMSIERAGRRVFIIVGLLFMGAADVMFGIGFVVPALADNSTNLIIIAVICIAVYVAAFEFSVGPLFFVVSSEVFPQDLRGIGLSFASVVQAAANLAVSYSFLPLTNGIGSGPVFFIYGGFGFACCILAFLFQPETKGVSLEDMAAAFDRQAHKGDKTDKEMVPAEESGVVVNDV